MLNADCLILIFKAVKSNPLDTAVSIPHQVHNQNLELLKLRQVRRGWKQLIDSQPYLWNSIAFVLGDHASMQSAGLFLRYSRKAVIHIYGHGAALIFSGLGTTSALDWRAKGLAERLKKQLHAASDRIISFHISKPEEHILDLWPVHAPNLKELVIETTRTFPAVFHGDMPLLRSVITPVNNGHRYLLAHNITSLTLYPPYTLVGLLSTLENTPLLRKLELRRILELHRNDLPRVRLSYLEDLYLVNSWRDIISFIDFPEHARITVTVPEHLRAGVSWKEFDTLSSFFIPFPFLQSSALSITTNEVTGPTQVRIVGQNTAGMGLCHVYIDINKNSGIRHRIGASKYGVGMVRNLLSVSSVRFNLQVEFCAKFTPWLRRFEKLRELALTGPKMYPLLRDLVSEEVSVVPSLQRLVLDQAFNASIYHKFSDWIAAREQAGYKVVAYLVPIEID